MSILLSVKDLRQRFDLDRSLLSRIHFEKGRIVCRKRIVHAVNGISFDLMEGQVYSLVGESGCGKSTAARSIIRLIEPAGGSVTYRGQDITHIPLKEMLPLRKKMQMIFQDPFASLNPRQSVMEILTEPMLFHHVAKTPKEARERALALLNRVGIRPEQADRYPHQFSGGQRQRIGIARALAVEPEFIIADEPVSALDVSIQAQILNLLMDLKDEFHFSYLFIAHNLSVVKHISNQVAVMYLGSIVEKSSKEQIFSSPLHPYTKALFSSIPTLSGHNMSNAQGLEGEIPSAVNLPSGCCFHTRCRCAMPICSQQIPETREVEPGHFTACHLFDR
ncbi:MAG: ABC transporter ATP-binding protein [Pyramidobacter sp.]|jgi:peptide/nickel transport system ATP-binding protein